MTGIRMSGSEQAKRTHTNPLLRTIGDSVSGSAESTGVFTLYALATEFAWPLGAKMEQ